MLAGCARQSPEERAYAAALVQDRAAKDAYFAGPESPLTPEQRATFHGLRYYPKLVCGPPFTPATGRRLLLRPGSDAERVRTALLATARALMRESRASSLHALFADETDREWLTGRGLLARKDCQFHWHNQGYGTETEKLRHNFVGKGWYKRTVEIPGAWAGRRLPPQLRRKRRRRLQWAAGSPFSWACRTAHECLGIAG